MRFEVTLDRICFLGLTFVMVIVMYGLGIFLPGGCPASSSLLPVKSLSKAPLSTEATFSEASTPPQPQVFPAEIAVQTAQELRSAFKEHDFVLSVCKKEGCVQVPRLGLASLPSDLKSLSAPQKKDLFLRSHLPLVLKANEIILQERETLEAILCRYEKGGKGSLSCADQAFVQKMMTKYRLKKWDLKELLKRVDILPPSLALGQSAVESGWGTSFAAREKNSTFGMTVRNRVLGYSSLQECVDSYIRNINANPAYKELREIRARLRHKGGSCFCSEALAEGLVRYSELGHLYIKKVKTIIRSNNLKRFDTAQLVGPPAGGISSS